ncbi:MAG: SoxR reducing system RseC family protein [Methanoculleaceae archaeon]
MIETGKILEIRGDRAKISLPLKEGCSTCGKCTLGKGEKYMRLEVETIPGARVGDEVMVEVPERDPLVAATLLFGFPLLGLLSGGGAGYLLFSRWGGDPNAGAGLLGLITMAGVFVILRRRERERMKKDGGGIRIVKNLPPGELESLSD